MAIGPGSRIGPYEVTALIGEGGMGRVWRAHHSGLKRDDALKVLPDVFAADPERLARFQREAQVLASLNHPNIAHVHGFEQADGVQALIMELVEGPTLAERIAQGAIPADEALAIARQVAEALEAAHERGIIHRDLKPANVKVRLDGTVKVLDFGLAKALEPMAARVDPTASPTITSPAMVTGVGVLLGTAAYMSPEQARGKPADRRADMWAFGCVLYEMLTGGRAFDGVDVTDTLAAVVRGEPDWSALPADTPQSIRRLLRRALAKDPRARLADMADARLEMEDASREETSATPHVSRPSRRREFMWAGVALALLATTIFLAIAMRPGRLRGTPTVVRFEVVPPDGAAITAKVSPDGRLLAFVTSRDGKLRLSVRPLNAVTTQDVAGTEGMDPDFFWSPDSRSVGFSSAGRLITVSIDGVSRRVLATLPNAQTYVGAWSADDDILLGVTNFTVNLGTTRVDPLDDGLNSGLLRVSGRGGQAMSITTPDASLGEQFHSFPYFLPDGRHYLFMAAGRGSAAYVGTLDSDQRVPLPGIASRIVYSSTGHLLFIRDGALVVQGFDAERLELRGQPISIVDQLVRLGLRNGSFSVSSSGVLTHSSSDGQTISKLVWFDRTGKDLGAVAPPAVYVNPELSKDDNYVAWDEGPFPDSHTWIRDLKRGSTTRFIGGIPQWSPDGRTLAFRLDGDVPGSLYQRQFGAVGDATLLIKSGEPKIPTDWSLDGRVVVYIAAGDVWLLQLPENKPVQVTATPFSEGNARISPDGRWIAYESNEGGSNRPDEVYIQSLSADATKIQVSTMGGNVPRWRRDAASSIIWLPISGSWPFLSRWSVRDRRLVSPFRCFRRGRSAPQDFRARVITRCRATGDF
jgi:eukaryotic-like serine/threonine-protein kinase